ncbi:protein rep [Comamonas aquatica]|uniref:protein rep n=1 Tax=Comamonas aquatica TaxID=225991 RepID=UPI0034D41903
MVKNNKQSINEVFSKEQRKVIFEKYSDFGKIDSEKEDEKLSKNDDKNSSLGIYAKSSPTLEDEAQAKNSINTKVREIYHSNRIKRYKLIKNARNYLLNFARKTNIKTNELHKLSRTINCKHALNSNSQMVAVDFNSKNAFYTGLQTCGSVWTCPICAARITEVRRQEIATAIDEAYKLGYQSAMITFTFPHKNTMSLEDALDKQSKALALFRKGNVWDTYKKKINFLGLIRALEVTHGSNGWHPHTHELWFIDPKVNGKAFKAFVLNRWIDCLKKVGLLPQNPSKQQLEAVKKHSVDVKMNCKASDYIAKADSSANWGIDRELAKAANKGKGKGLHPFELLAEDTPKNQGLFIEFVQAIKGKSQLFWSHGLKEKLGINQLTDEEIAENEEDDEEPIHNKQIYFTEKEWKLILNKEYRAQILNRFELAEDLSKEYKAIIEMICGKIDEDDVMKDCPF